jgi:hypothetical protein
MDGDSFVSTPPNPAQLEAFRAAIAALDALPKPPSGVAEKRAWLDANRGTLEAAQKGLGGLRDAEFFHKLVPAAEVDALAGRVAEAAGRFREVEEEAGLREPARPASPFRPLFGATNTVRSWMSNPLGAVVGTIAIVPAVALDALDAVTRPLQAVAYPLVWGKYKVDQAQYEAARKK